MEYNGKNYERVDIGESLCDGCAFDEDFSICQNISAECATIKYANTIFKEVKK